MERLKVNIFLCDMVFMVDTIDIASYADNTPYSVGNLLTCQCLDINTKFLLPACILENSNSQKLLGVTIDRKLNFNKHFPDLCDTASKKIQTLARIFPYILHTHK